MSSSATETMTLTAGGVAYEGWTEISFGRGLSRCVSDFDIGVTEGWPVSPRPILPFTPTTISIGGDLAFTGFVDTYLPALKANEHGVRLTGRSKTCDLVDCTPVVQAGQFSGYTVTAIARAICKIFGLTLVQQTILTDVVVPDATFQPTQSAFEFLDRLFTLVGAIALDDENGNLLVTTAGAARSSTHLQQGVNIKEMSATITAKDRYSEYIVIGQAGLAAGIGASGQTTPDQAQVQTAQQAIATDATVPRYRPKTWLSRSATGQAPLATQANWHLNYAVGQATKAEVTVQGWRQNDGTLWQANQLVAITAPYIGVDQDLLVYDLMFKFSRDGGRETVLTLAPVQSAQPNPQYLRVRKTGKKGRGGSGINWDGAGG